MYSFGVLRAVAAIVAAFLLTLLVGDQPAMGDPVGSTDAKEQPSGPDEPDDDDILDLPTSGDDDEDEDGLWQANVGGTDFSGLDEDNVGDVLFRGKLTTQTFVDEYGNEQSVRVCTDITETQLRIVYSAPSMNILSYFTSCDADSPAGVIRWIERSCYHGASESNSSEVGGYVRGTYDAWPLTDAEHQSSVSFNGYSNGYRATCWWSDDLDNVDLFGILTVRLRCDEQ